MSEPPLRQIGGVDSLNDGLPRRPSASILRTGSRTDLAALDEEGDSGDESWSRQQQQMQQAQQLRMERTTEDKKRASFSQQGPERFEFTPGSAPGGKIVQEVPPSVTRRRPARPSIRSSGGGSQASLTPSSASNLSETSSWSSWSHRALRLFPCCIDRHKERGPVATFLVKLLFCPYEPPAKLLEYMHIVISSWGYGIPFLFFTVLLLFGESVQYLWFPKEADVVFNYLYTFAFAFFVIDVVMRCYVSPPYFVFEFFGRDYRYDAQGRRKPRPPVGGTRSGWGESWIKIGSFMFWCDVISTLTLLYDISWINPALEERTELTIPVNAVGVATEGETLNESSAVERDLGLLVAVGRTARIARFIRATTIVKASGRFFGFAWLPSWMYPAYWMKRFRGSDTKNGPTGGTILEELAAAEAATTGRSRRRSTNLNGGLSAAAIATIQEEDAGIFKKCVGFITCRKMCSREKEDDGGEGEQNEAAVRIQKAWKVSNGNNFMSSVHPKSLAKSVLPSSLTKSQKASTSSIGSAGKRKSESQVGTAMREITGQRVAIGIILSLIITVLFTYREVDDSPARTMVMLHNQTAVSDEFKDIAISAARESAIPSLFSYEDASDNVTYYDLDTIRPQNLREREILEINITDGSNSTLGTFSYEKESRDQALVRLISTIFIILIWLFGVNSFAGPVMTLVVVPIERMVRLLSMLMRDPLGYQTTERYKHFVIEEDDFLQNTNWSKDVLKGMETNFLMSTILRIGSLMKVGFGAAGVEIIRQSLDQQSQENQKHEGIALHSKGSTVKCIFLFCDIRQFTDATESLQEEVFVFTNQIASVIHSICNSYGGSANKNVGDAFLMSWLLEDESKSKERRSMQRNSSFLHSFDAEDDDMECQADKALYAVVRICIALYHDQYYIETLSSEARERLLKKIGKRHGPVVQMGFGLHMGKAVQGAIGSERKLDATYISEAVEFAEFLESSTKQYGLKMLMSDAFYDLLDPINRRRCRKIDQLFIPNEEEEEYLDGIELLDISEKIELYTYDMDVEAIWRDTMERAAARSRHDGGSESASEQDHSAIMGISSLLSPQRSTGGTPSKKMNRRMQMVKGSGGGGGPANSRRDVRGAMGASAPARPGMVRRASLFAPGKMKLSEGSRDAAGLWSSDLLKRTPSLLEFDYGELNDRGVPSIMPPLVLPSSNAMYNSGVWNSKEIKKIRQRFSDGLFFQKFSEGLQAYYSRDWELAKRCFRTILDRIEDGPSRYFMKQMDEHGGVPPRNFLPYGRV